ncbi:unnamed protein product [Notodromas monacha]|uniref:Golgi resident protein GCP60 n=1 Tax=Notodromas monacha TaxID=399045 RepID=A0A7R9BWL6_9CRUS|nr:unnamed protein product [Notodromas monacha]CAG0923084.1 unnamed protein product [Notodromas monacha]
MNPESSSNSDKPDEDYTATNGNVASSNNVELPLKELFSLGVRFFKEKSGGKAATLSYEERVALVAYTQQATHGKFDESRAQPLGYLDVIGHDRRKFWKNLGDMSKEEAMEKFVSRLTEVSPVFVAYVEAHKRDKESKLKSEEDAAKEKELAALQAVEKEREVLKQEAESRQQEERKRLIQDALNAQTYPQFKAYAEQQYPGNPEQQAVLIKQLQQQHYIQYMQQIYQQPEVERKEVSSEEEPESNEGEEEGGDYPRWSPATMWTRHDIKEFKEGVRKEGGDSVIRVGHGETVTVRVPTHEDGNCLFWEFATDSYDIGFGLFFEWVKSPTEQVSVHISESEDEEEEEIDEDDDNPEAGRKASAADEPPTTVLIPVYRRDCHEEVYVGSHDYPGQGVYLLKFDNAYSLWRSKTLYYRVYYTR